VLGAKTAACTKRTDCFGLVCRFGEKPERIANAFVLNDHTNWAYRAHRRCADLKPLMRIKGTHRNFPDGRSPRARTVQSGESSNPGGSRSPPESSSTPVTRTSTHRLTSAEAISPQGSSGGAANKSLGCASLFTRRSLIRRRQFSGEADRLSTMSRRRGRPRPFWRRAGGRRCAVIVRLTCYQRRARSIALNNSSACSARGVTRVFVRVSALDPRRTINCSAGAVPNPRRSSTTSRRVSETSAIG